MKKKIVLIIAVIIFAIGSFMIVDMLNEGRKHTGDVEITHDLGTTLVSKNPKKVVVFDFGILETLDKLGIEVLGVPKASLPIHLNKYNSNKYTDVGTLFEPNFELLYDLAPDLIIISGRQSSLYSEFDDVAPTIYLPIVNTNFVESFEHNIKTLEKIFTKEDKFADYLEEVKKDIEDLNSIATNSNLKALVLMVSTDSISALGIGSRYDVVHNEFGVKPAAPNITISTHGQTVTYEYILEVNPDIIYVVDRALVTEGTEIAKQMLNNSFVNQTKAAVNGKIIYLSSAQWYISTGGIDSMKVMINEIRSAFE